MIIIATDNVTIMHRVWLNGTNDFQQRITEPTQANIANTVDALFDPLNRNYYNQFVDALICRIGMTYVHQQTWRNPLEVFKKSRMPYGLTAQEIAVKWIKAHSYVDDAEDVFKMHRPDAAVWYHDQNRQDMYPITVNRTELRTAFTSADDGLNRFIAAVLDAPLNSDNYDEYRIMLQLIAEYENRWGFYKHQLSGVPNDEQTAKEFLKAVRTYAGRLRFPSTQYNSGVIDDLPVFANRNELILMVTPEINASIDVDALAVLFNADRAETQLRTIEVDEFPLPSANCIGLLTTEDFFQCRDTVYENASIYNPKTLSTNYFLHHWGIYSVSPFVPAIMFTTQAGTSIPTFTQTVTGLTLTADNMTPKAGDKVQLTVTLGGSITPESHEPFIVAPNAATFNVVVTRTVEDETTAVDSPRTRVDKYGVLHIDEDLSVGDVITVEATSTYINPSGNTTQYTDTISVTVS